MLFLQGEGDVVTATALPGKPGLVVIESVTGDDGRLPREPNRNCVGIAALEALEMIAAQCGRPACGVALRLEKVLARRIRCTVGIATGCTPCASLGAHAAKCRARAVEQ